ncbi:unnamed protein product [Prunus armeniaca]
MSNLLRVLERQQKQREETRRRRAQEDREADEEEELLLAAAVCMMPFVDHEPPTSIEDAISLTSANSGFSPGKTCPWASSGSWDPPPNWATGPALELSRAASGSLSPGLLPALEMLLG